MSAGTANWGEIGKFARLMAVWMVIIFGAVWVACWLVGVAIPMWLEAGAPSPFGNLIVADDVWQAVANTLRAITPLLAVMVFIPINAMFMVLAERRGLALFTVRKGPNRVGPDGLAQTLADALKLLFKEDITPRGADAVLFTAAPIIFFAPSIFGVVPLLAAMTSNHDLFKIANLPTGIFYVLAAASIPVVGLVMGTWASNNKYSLVGGLRSAAQAISYEIPLVISIITICLMAGTLDVVAIANEQEGNLLNWYVFGGGALLTGFSKGIVGIVASLGMLACGVMLFLLYITTACAEVNRIPFDLPEAESELVSGFNTEYSGIKFAIFFLAEFTNLFVVSSIAATLFLGGTHGPIPALDTAMVGALAKVEKALPFLSSFLNPVTATGAFWVLLKTYSLVIFAILVRGTLPRFRIDQLMDFGWKRLVPLSLLLLIAVTFLKELV